MKFNIKNIIIIMVMLIILEIIYLMGFYAPNKIVYSNNDEVLTEDIIENSNCNFDSESNVDDEFLDLNIDLTNVDDCAIIMTESEIATDDVEIENNFSDISDEQIILSEREIDHIDYIELIDSYEKGEWYCYYLHADGDCYVVTIKCGHVDVFVQLN